MVNEMWNSDLKTTAEYESWHTSITDKLLNCRKKQKNKNKNSSLPFQTKTNTKQKTNLTIRAEILFGNPYTIRTISLHARQQKREREKERKEFISGQLYRGKKGWGLHNKQVSWLCPRKDQIITNSVAKTSEHQTAVNWLFYLRQATSEVQSNPNFIK